MDEIDKFDEDELREGRCFNPVYKCKLCDKTIVNTLPTQAIWKDDMEDGLANLHEYTNLLEENTRLHNHIDGSDCFGICSFIGFQKISP